MGGSSKKVTVGYKYYLGAHMVLGHGPFDKITRIEIDDREAYLGNATGGTILINKPSLFGGDSREGGVSGAVDIDMGEETQTRNTYLQSVLGDAIPAFRGVVSAVLNQVYVGNNPYLKPWKFRAQRIFASEGSFQWYEEKAAIPGLNSQYISQDSGPWRSLVVDYNDAADYSGVAVDDSAWDIIETPIGSEDNPQAASNGFPESPATIVPLQKATWLRGFIEVDNTQDFVWESYVDNDLEVWVNGVQVIDDTGNTFGHYYATTIPASAFNLGSNLIVIKATDDANLNPSVDKYYFGVRMPPTLLTHLDMNPAHIIRECLTNSIWGLGYQDADIDDAAFMLAADTLYDEKMGMSLLWDGQKTMQDFIQDVLRHIDAQLYIDRISGQFVLYLIRDDYSVSDLLVLDQSNTMDITRPQRPALGELTNSVTVVFWDQTTGEDGSTVVQDHALARQQGAVVPTKRQYPGFTNISIANLVALRDLAALSTPILTCTIIANREASALHIGEPFVLNRPDVGINNLIMRCQEIYFGNGKTNAVKIVAAQDVFAFPEAAAGANIPNDFIPPTNEPLPSDPRVVIEEPYYELVQEFGQTQVDDNLAINPQLGYLLVAGGRQSNEINATLFVDAGAGFIDSSPLDFVPYNYLESPALGYLDSVVDVVDGVDIDDLAVGDIGQIDDELVVVQAIASDSSTVTIGRGVLDTVPTEHASGTPIVFWGVSAASDDVEYQDGETIDVKIITATGGAELALADAPTDSLTFDSRAIRPYPPGNLKINDEAYPALVTGEATISWSHRDRLQQTSGTIYDTTEGNIGPEAGVEYNLYLYDETNTLVRTVNTTATSYTWTTEEVDSGLSRLNYEFRLVLESIRFDNSADSTGVVSWQAHDFIASRLQDSSGIAGDLYYEYVSLLLHCDGTNGSTTFTDSSRYSRSVTAQGNAQIDTATPKFGTGALELDGNGDHLTINVAEIGSADFTLEAWFRMRSAGLGDAFGRMFQFGLNATDGGLYLVHSGGPSNPFRVLTQVYDSGYQNIFSPAASSSPDGELADDTWVHFAIQRAGDEWSTYFDGLRDQFDDTPPTGAALIDEIVLNIGDNPAGTESINALVDDIRLTVGVARYSGSGFSVPIAPFDDYGPMTADANFNDVVVLMHFDGADASTTFTDEIGHTFVAQGNAQLDIDQIKFGIASGLFDGTGDYVYSTWSTDYEISATDATLECWIRTTSSKSVQTVIGTRETSAPDHGFQIDIQNGSAVRVWAWNTAGSQVINFNSTDGITLNNWHHIAVTREQSTGEWTIFIDGVLKAQATESGAFEDSGYRLGIGIDFSGAGGARYFQGHIDELRITKGALRYTVDFSIPRIPFPDFGPSS